MSFGTGILGLSLLCLHNASSLSLKSVQISVMHLKGLFALSDRADTDFPADHGVKAKTTRISASAVRGFVFKFWRKVQETEQFH